MFGFDRLEAVIMESIELGQAQQIATYIIDAVQDFMGEAEQHDDMTVVVVVQQ